MRDFRSGPREVVNIAKLRIEYKQIDRVNGEMRRFTQPLENGTIDMLKTQLPRTYARMTTRPMQLLKAGLNPPPAQRQPGPSAQNAAPKTAAAKNAAPKNAAPKTKN